MTAYSSKSHPNSTGGRVTLFPDRRGLLYFIASLVTLTGLPLYVIPNLALGSSTMLVGFGLMTYSAIRLSLLVARGMPSLMECAFWTFTYSFLTLPMLAQMTAQTYPLATSYSYDAKVFSDTQIMIVVGLLGYELGHLLRRRERPGRRSVARSLVGTISTRRAAAVGYVGLVFVAIAVARYGLSGFFTSRDALTQNFLGRAPVGVKFYLTSSKAGGSTLQALTQVPVFIGAYMLLYTRRLRREAGRTDLPSWWLIGPLLIGNVIVNNPIANARYWFGTVLIAFVSIYLPLRKKTWAARLFIVLFVWVSLFSFHQLAAFRRTGAADLSSQSISTNLIADPDYASPQQMMTGVRYVAQHGYALGHQLLGSIFVWVPRSLWPGKAGGTGVLVGGQDAGFNVSAPLWLEGFVDFGMFGVLAYLLILGVTAVRLDHAYARKSTRSGLMAAVAPIVASLIVFLVRGSLQPALGTVTAVLGCVALCGVYRPRRRHSPDLKPISTSLLQEDEKAGLVMRRGDLRHEPR